MKKNIQQSHLRCKCCPECGSLLIPEAGCFYCKVCGFSLCSC